MGIPFLRPPLQKAPKEHGWVRPAALLFSPTRGCLLTPQEPALEVTRGPIIQEPTDRPQPPLTHCSFLSSASPSSTSAAVTQLSRLLHPYPISHPKPGSSQAQPQTRQSLPALCSSDLTRSVVPHSTPLLSPQPWPWPGRPLHTSLLPAA